MQSWRIGWRRAGVAAVLIGLLSSCLLTSNFDGLTGGKVPVDGGDEAGNGGMSSSSSSSSASSSSSSGSGGGFPTTNVLDDFNRPDGQLGGQWLVDTPGAYTIAGNQLAYSTGDPGVMIWPAQFGATQEAFITFGTVESTDMEHELILKSQGGMVQECESIQVDYTSGGVDVVRCTGGNFVYIGTVNVTFSVGDQLGARARADGMVEIYKNGTLLQTLDANAWPFAKGGGRIGFASYGVMKAGAFDNFGGG